MSQHTEPQFDVALLLRAAQIAGLDAAQIPGDLNPWQWQDPRAQSWRSAIRVLNPSLADAAEAQWGESMSLALRGALAGDISWNVDLEKELEARRPGLAKEREEAAVKAALKQMAASHQAEKEALAVRTPSPAELRHQQIASMNRAAEAARIHAGIEA
jgi:hypothetical protein